MQLHRLGRTELKILKPGKSDGIVSMTRMAITEMTDLVFQKAWFFVRLPQSFLAADNAVAPRKVRCYIPASSVAGL